MTGYKLSPQVGFGLVEGHPISLDLKRDRYFRLGGEAGAELNELLTLQARTSILPRFDRLLATGLVERTTAGGKLAAAPSIPLRSSALDLDGHRASFRNILDAWLRLAFVHRQLRRGRLAALVDRLALGKLAVIHQVTADADPVHCADAAARYATARRLVPIKPNCLEDSLALAFHLAARGHRPHLIFAVKLNPFAAHCWVQAGDILLNDSCDTVEQFTPVLAA